MGREIVREGPKAVELLQIALGGMAGLVGGALAGGMGGAMLGLIAALKRIEGEDGRGRPAKAAVAQAPAPDDVRQAETDPRLPGRSAA